MQPNRRREAKITVRGCEFTLDVHGLLRAYQAATPEIFSEEIREFAPWVYTPHGHEFWRAARAAACEGRMPSDSVLDALREYLRAAVSAGVLSEDALPPPATPQESTTDDVFTV